MTGKTHTRIGMVAALVLLQPQTVPECLCVALMGAAGGGICDIDLPNRKNDGGISDENDQYGDAEIEDKPYDGSWIDYLFKSILLFLYLGIDYYSGNGVCNEFISNFGINTMIAVTALAIVVLCGMFSKHRSFMHSVLACFLISGCLFFISKPLMIPFAVGFASHVLLDICNKRGIQLLWPLKFKLKFNLCSFDGKANDILCALGKIFADLLFFYFMIPAIWCDKPFFNIIQNLRNPIGAKRITLLAVYLISVNIITFIVEATFHVMWEKKSGVFYQKNYDYDMNKAFTMTRATDYVCDFLYEIGGALGGLFSFFLIIKHIGEYRKTEKKDLLGTIIVTFCLIIEWICIYIIIINPDNILQDVEQYIHSINGIGVIIYILLINTLTFLMFYTDKSKSTNITNKDILELIIAFVGGASGGYIAMSVTGRKLGQTHMLRGILKMIEIQCLLMSCLLIVFRGLWV